MTSTCAWRDDRAHQHQSACPAAPEPREQAGLEGQVVVAVPGVDGRAVAVLAEHERFAPRRGAVDADEQAALLRPGDQVAMAAHVHGDSKASLFDLEVIEMARREHQQLLNSLAEPDVPFIVTPLAAEADFMRDHDGEVRLAEEVELRRARM